MPVAAPRVASPRVAAAVSLAPAADIAMVAVVPSTNVRREISVGSDTIAPQRLAHAMHRAAAVAYHGHVGIVDSEPFCAAGCDQILARGRHQHAFIAESDDVRAHLHGVAVGNGHGADPLRAQPLDELRLDRFHAYNREAFGDHAHLHIQMQEMRIEGVRVEFPSLGLEPALQLPYRGLDGALARIAASGHAWLEHHEVAALDIARGDQVVNRNTGFEIELQAGRILAAPVGLLQLHDHGPPGSHHAAVAREYLIGQCRVGRKMVHLDVRLPVDVDHLAVLPARDREIELQTNPFGAFAHGVARLPSKVIDGSDQYIAQGAVFAVDTPGAERARAAAFGSRPQLHREIPPSRSASAGTADIIPIALADVSRHRGGERLSFVDDPGGHRSSAVAARGGNEAVHRAARIEEAVAGFEQSVGLSLCLEYQATLEHIAGLVPRVGVIADTRARRQHGRPDHDFLARHARLIVAFKYRAHRLRRGFRLLGGGAQGQYEGSDQ